MDYSTLVEENDDDDIDVIPKIVESPSQEISSPTASTAKGY